MTARQLSLLPALLAACAPVLGDLSVEPGRAIANDHVRIELTRRGDATTGFTLAVAGRETARALLGPQNLIVSRHAIAERDAQGARIVLPLTTAGDFARLGPESRVEVVLREGDRWPRVSFSLDLQAFDPEAWQQAVGGPLPFHYLLCELPGATMFYQGGGLTPSREVDPYPMSTEGYVTGLWAKGWSSAPAMAGWAVPAVGLWNPKARTFAAYDFNEARHTDRSSRFVASAYCENPGGTPFFCLVHPYQKQWVVLTYPETPCRVASHFELLYSQDLPDTSDPNMFVLERLWREHRDLLPPVPQTNDLAWIPEYDGYAPAGTIEPTSAGTYLTGLSGPSGLAGAFVEVGSRMLGNVFISDGVMRARFRGDEASLEPLKRDLEYLMPRCTWVDLGGERCATWVHPIEGKFQDRWGGEACAGIFHTRNFQIGAGMLLLYEMTGDERLLPFVDGVYNLCRHYLFTRNGVCDLPWAMFCRVGTAAGEQFLLNYRRVFKDDAVRGRNCDEALDLARMSLYKVLWFYTADPDLDDDLDPLFLNQAVNDRRWCGRVTWNECGWVLRTMVPVYCETADPFLKYLLRGSIERYYAGFREDGGVAENLQIFGEIEPKGVRTAGFSDACHGGNVRRWARACADARLRVAMGQRAAIGFGLDSRAYDIEDYRYKEGSGFSFRLVAVGPGPAPEKALDLVATAPFRDLSGKPIKVDGQALPEARYELNPMTRGEDVYIHDVPVGATVEIGDTSGAEPAPPDDLPYRGRAGVQADGWRALDLSASCNEALPMTWWDDDAWYGLVPGVRHVWGMPVALVDPELNAGRNAVSRRAVVLDSSARAVFAVFGTHRGQDRAPGSLSLTTADGRTHEVVATDDLPFDLCNGFPLRRFDTYLAALDLGKTERLRSVEVRDGILLALTLAEDGAKGLDAVLARAYSARAARLAEQAQRYYQAPDEACPVLRPWAAPELPYRFRLSVLAGPRQEGETLVSAREDVGALLAQVGAPAAAPKRFRAFEALAGGKTREVPVQFDPLATDDDARGELFLLLPASDNAGGSREADVYFGPDGSPAPPAVKADLTADQVSVTTGRSGLEFVFALSGDGPNPRWTRLAFDTNGDGLFTDEAKVLGATGYSGGYGALTCVTDRITWYDFGLLQSRPAKAEVLHQGPVSTTIRVSGLELWGHGDEAVQRSNVDGRELRASPKGEAEWFFRFYPGRPQVEQWVSFRLDDPDTGWTRPLQVRYGLERIEQGANLSVNGVRAGHADDAALLPLAGEPTRLPVACTYTPDGHVLQGLFVRADAPGEYFMGRWLLTPRAATEAAYTAYLQGPGLKQYAVELLRDGQAVTPEPADLPLVAFDSTGGRGPIPRPERREVVIAEGTLNPDPSLEERDRFWALGGGDQAGVWTETQVYSGEVAADLSCADGEIGMLQTKPIASRQLALEPNSMYEVTLWAKCTSGPGQLHLNFYAPVSGYDFPHAQVPLEADGEWHQVRAELPTGALQPLARDTIFPRAEEVLPALRIWTHRKQQSVYVDQIQVRRQ